MCTKSEHTAPGRDKREGPNPQSDLCLSDGHQFGLGEREECVWKVISNSWVKMTQTQSPWEQTPCLIYVWILTEQHRAQRFACSWTVRTVLLLLPSALLWRDLYHQSLSLQMRLSQWRMVLTDTFNLLNFMGRTPYHRSGSSFPQNSIRWNNYLWTPLLKDNNCQYNKIDAMENGNLVLWLNN